MPHLQPRLAMRPKTHLYVPTSVLAAIYQEGWTHCPLETGGILLGHQQGTRIQITHTIGPGPKASHERYGFTPDDTWQAEQTARIWSAHPETQYLGDWHTHPGGRPRPSPLDQKTLRTIADHAPARQPTPVMLILALNTDGTTDTRAVQLKNNHIRPLQVTVTADQTSPS